MYFPNCNEKQLIDQNSIETILFYYLINMRPQRTFLVFQHIDFVNGPNGPMRLKQ